MKVRGFGDYLSKYLKNLQKRLISIYNLARKGVQLKMDRRLQKNLKKGISNPPVLVMANNTRCFGLVSDTSGGACGAILYQEQRG